MTGSTVHPEAVQDCVEEPEQAEPPPEGAGLVQVRACVPALPSEVSEVQTQDPQADQPPSTRVVGVTHCPEVLQTLPPEHFVPVPEQVRVGAAPVHSTGEQVEVTPALQSAAVFGIAVPQATEEAL